MLHMAVLSCTKGWDMYHRQELKQGEEIKQVSTCSDETGNGNMM